MCVCVCVCVCVGGGYLISNLWEDLNTKKGAGGGGYILYTFLILTLYHGELGSRQASLIRVAPLHQSNDFQIQIKKQLIIHDNKFRSMFNHLLNLKK